MPNIEKLKPVVYKSVLQEMQRLRVAGTKEELKGAHAKRSQQLVRLNSIYHLASFLTDILVVNGASK
jgi:hypothetical protein